MIDEVVGESLETKNPSIIEGLIVLLLRRVRDLNTCIPIQG